METNNVVFSVIMPVYKTEKFIQKSIESVLNQSFKNFELICVNDCTPDNAFGICKKYSLSDSRIRCIDSNKNVGISETRNIGLRNAKGKYILFLDSDDEFELRALASLYEVIKTHDPDCIFFGYRNVYENKQTSDILCNLVCGSYTKDLIEKAILSVMNHEFLSCIGSKAYKRSVLLDNQCFFNPNHLYNEDIGFCLNVISCCESFYYLNDCLYRYNIRTEGSTMSSYKPEMFEHIILARRLYERLIPNYENQKQIANLQISNYYKIIIGGAFGSLVNEKKYGSKTSFKKEVSVIAKDITINKAFLYFRKNKNKLNFKKRFFLKALIRKHSRILYLLVK